MTRKFLLMTLSIGAMMLATKSAFAQSRNCADHESIVVQLASRYGESRQSIGLGQDNSVLEVFASTETGTWTITVTMPGGLTCLVAAGEAFQQVAEALPNTDNGA